MRPHLRASAQFTLRRTATTVLAVLLALGLAAPGSLQTTATTAAAATTTNVVTPGNFTGYGFDQCLAPNQAAMTTWLETSPFLAVGIYISGNSRACREQPNLTPTWVSTQLKAGWRLLPITLGPQASCSTRFPRYDDDPTINPDPTNTYAKARVQGRSEASSAVSAAEALGIRRGSTLWYDLEAFDISRTYCRESALRFLSAWTAGIHDLGYVSGVYSSAASGIKILDNARINRPNTFNLPDYLWIARWDQTADTRTTYISDEGWNPHRRVKQYQGGHNETWGGVTINIDRNWLDVGRGSVAPSKPVHCGGVNIDFKIYNVLRPGVYRPANTKALQCLLRERRIYDGRINGRYNDATIAAARIWQRRMGATRSSTWSVENWMTLLSYGPQPVLKIGSARQGVRRLQRAINAGLSTGDIAITGLFDRSTDTALRAWQKAYRVPVTGVAASPTWTAMAR